MRFHYIAFQPDGKVTESELDAKDQVEVLKFLAQQGLRPITVKPVALNLAKQSRRFFGEKIIITDKVFLAKYLALMLKVGTDLFKTIDILIADFDKPAIKAFLGEVRSALERGEPFYSTFAKYPRFFSETFVNLVKAGEESGNLDRVFNDLSVSLEKESELRSRIKGALVYPVLLMIMATVILTFLVTFALPRIAEVFSGGGLNPPLFSRVVFAVGLFLGKYVWYILGFGALALTGAGIFFSKTLLGRRVLAQISNVTPVVKVLVKKLALQRFTATFSALLQSGMPIINSLEITANAVGNEEIKTSLRRIAREGITKGLTVGDAFKREPAFPKVVANLVAISEKAGHLDEILKTLSEFYDVEIDRALKTLVSFLEPVLLIAIGIVVALIALSIIIPIYQLISQF